METIEGAGVVLARAQRGAGPAVLLIHGMADDHHGWDGLGDTLSDAARVVVYDRRGYGESGAPEPYERTTVAEQAQDAAAVLRTLGAGPAIVVGRDLAALVALDLAARHGELVRGLVLVDPFLFEFVPAATEALAEERRRLEDVLRAEDAAGAVAAWLTDRLTEPSHARLARARANPRAFFADYGAQATWPVTRRELRDLAAPLVVVSDPTAPAHVRAAVRILADLRPEARIFSDGELEDAVRTALPPPA